MRIVQRQGISLADVRLDGSLSSEFERAREQTKNTKKENVKKENTKKERAKQKSGEPMERVASLLVMIILMILNGYSAYSSASPAGRTSTANAKLAFRLNQAVLGAPLERRPIRFERTQMVSDCFTSSTRLLAEFCL